MALPEKYQDLQKFLNGAKESIRLIDAEINRLENTNNAPRLAPVGAPPEVPKEVKIMNMERQKTYWQDAVWTETEKSVKGADAKEASQVLKTVRDELFPNKNNAKGVDEINQHRGEQKEIEDSQDYMDFLKNSRQNQSANINKTTEPATAKAKLGDSNHSKQESKTTKEMSPGEQYAQSLNYQQKDGALENDNKEIGRDKDGSTNLNSKDNLYSPGLDYSLSLSFSDDIGSGSATGSDKGTIEIKNKGDEPDKDSW